MLISRFNALENICKKHIQIPLTEYSIVNTPTKVSYYFIEAVFHFPHTAGQVNNIIRIWRDITEIFQIELYITDYITDATPLTSTGEKIVFSWSILDDQEKIYCYDPFGVSLIINAGRVYEVARHICRGYTETGQYKELPRPLFFIDLYNINRKKLESAFWIRARRYSDGVPKLRFLNLNATVSRRPEEYCEYLLSGFEAVFISKKIEPSVIIYKYTCGDIRFKYFTVDGRHYCYCVRSNIEDFVEKIYETFELDSLSSSSNEFGENIKSQKLDI